MTTTRAVVLLTLSSCVSMTPDSPRPLPENPAGKVAVPPKTPAVVLVGRWTADARTRGGLGTSLEFHSDGTVLETFGALVDFTYEAKDGVLKTTFRDEEPIVQEIRFEGDSLHVTAGTASTDSTTTMTRIGPPVDQQKPLLGRWSFRHYTGQMGAWEYTSSGRAILSVPMMSYPGRFEATAETLTMVMDPDRTVRVPYETDGVHLVLTDAKGARQFTRIEP